MPRTLYGKLALAFLILIGLISAIYVALTLWATRLYLQEVNQKLNQTLASGIVAQTPLLQGGAVNQAAFRGLFHTLMVINPSIELYLLDPEGAILAYNAPPGRGRGIAHSRRRPPQSARQQSVLGGPGARGRPARGLPLCRAWRRGL